MTEEEAPAVVFDGVSIAFNDHPVLDNISFSVPKGRMTIILGASGSGKSVALKLILGLFRPDRGKILVNGHRIERLPEDEVDARVLETLGFVGLAEYGERHTTELSGGQRRRVAMARAMAARPSVLLLDDPTTGLDPITATSVDDEIVKLRDLQEVTSIVVTHQIRDAVYVATHQAVQRDKKITIEETLDSGERVQFLVLRDGRIHFEGTQEELLANSDAYLKEFLYMTLPPW
jgi:phospholipid/cholesterol/gamma-HCH transport system ATP-binding protein